MSLFGVDIKGILLENLGGQLNALTLHKVTSAIGAHGEPVPSSTDHSGEGVRTKWDHNTLVRRGWSDKMAKIIVLQDGIPKPEIGDAVTIGGERFSIIDVSQDPVSATWKLAGIAE